MLESCKMFLLSFASSRRLQIRFGEPDSFLIYFARCIGTLGVLILLRIKSGFKKKKKALSIPRYLNCMEIENKKS